LKSGGGGGGGDIAVVGHVASWAGSRVLCVRVHFVRHFAKTSASMTLL